MGREAQFVLGRPAHIHVARWPILQWVRWTISGISARTLVEVTALEAETQPASPRIVLVDDNEFLRRALREALQREGLMVIGEGASAEEAISLVADKAP